MNKPMTAIVLALSLAGVGCKAKATGADAVKQATEQRDQVCKCTDMACVDKILKGGLADAINEPAGKLDEASTKKLSELAFETAECMKKLAPPAPPPAAPAGSAADTAAAAPSSDLAPECAEWKATVDKLSACEKIPIADRKAMKQTFDNASAKWATMTAPEQKKTIAEECKTAAEMMKNAVKGCL